MGFKEEIENAATRRETGSKAGYKPYLSGADKAKELILKFVEDYCASPVYPDGSVLLKGDDCSADDLKDALKNYLGD